MHAVAFVDGKSLECNSGLYQASKLNEAMFLWVFVVGRKGHE